MDDQEADESISADIHVQIFDHYGTAFDDGPVTITETEHEVTFSRCDYKLVTSLDYSLAEMYVYDEFALKHALINLYSSWLIYRKRGLLIHSSCVVQDEKAFMFAGPSGAGKSTVAALSLPRPVLSDEATFLYVEDDGKVMVYDSPFRSDMEDPCVLMRSPLSGVHFIIQSMEVKRTPVRSGDGFIELLDKVFYWRHNDLETLKMISLCKQIAEQVPLYHLYFQKNDTFWERIS
ncbi:hypothetical protein JCM16418_2103 [Paenibacillus pini JCM 16418]|uniref:Uncharacterized protein n=2 Tax=Paenibacillus TaxID=44249 RepID=W7YB65_9BACL|nr:hypothetical protein JCM16418_2103 [Paenibacillus pini JCM 16418]